MKLSMDVDLAFVNGKIITLNEKDETAQAVAVSGGKILSVGSTKTILELTGKDTTVIELDGKTVTPGFVESHCHPSLAGPMLCFEVDVRATASIE